PRGGGRGGRVDERSADELRPERPRHADGARGGPPGGGAPARVLVVERPAGRERLPGSRGQAGRAALAVRRLQGDRRGVLLGLPRRLRHGRRRRALLERLRAAEALVLYGDGSQTRDFVFCEDLARGLVAAATTAGVGGQIFQLASGVETSLARLI